MIIQCQASDVKMSDQHSIDIKLLGHSTWE